MSIYHPKMKQRFAKGYWEDTLLGKEGGPHVIKDAVCIITGIYGRGWGMKPKVEQK